MITPDDLYALAQDLIGNNTESYQRSAVSRAYYAAYHAALALCERRNIELQTHATSHDRLINVLRNNTDVELRKLGNQLDRLRSARVKADYLLSISFNQSEARQRLVTASRVLHQIRQQ